MSEPTLIYLKMLCVEQKGWFTLRFEEQLPMTAQAMIGHISEGEVTLLSPWQQTMPTEGITQAEFRFINQSGVYTFSTQNVKITEKRPGTMMFSMRPSYAMTHHQQRGFIRFEPDELIHFSFSPLYPDDYSPGGGIIKDMSGSGLRFITDEFIHKESILRFEFILPEADQPIVGIGQVVRKEFINGETITSLRFLDVPTQAQKSIIAYSVAEQLRIAENQRKQKRKFGRITMRAPLQATIRGIDSHTTYEVSARNLGGGGMFVTSPVAVEVYPLFHIAFHLSDDTQACTGYVKVVEQTKHQQEYAYHLEFVEIHAEEQAAIVLFVLEQQLSLLSEPEQTVTQSQQ